jgi:hypothetical protein
MAVELPGSVRVEVEWSVKVYRIAATTCGRNLLDQATSA